ncbi:hypothetical protein B0A50_03989 [Salinomyces thailandicus]|uniref:DASH complex subunit DAM1 n=1 Tax=Salinomyces thailandicus TaxID=706561 RepID=A0A4U0TZS4_9PEZI|nr:hypothetical protein B0A50_03989 [Salinomyces thailandica]
MAHHYYSPLQDADRYRAPYTIPLNDAPAMSAASTASQSHHRNSSHSRPRPTTPLRPPSRTSLRASQTTPSGPSASHSGHDFPLADLEPAFAELSDGMADLEANFMHLQLLNESISRFNEDFAGFLYGLNMSAFCIDFPEAPIPQSFARHPSIPPQSSPDSPFHHRRTSAHRNNDAGIEMDATFLTTDTSFVDNPPTSVKPGIRKIKASRPAQSQPPAAWTNKSGWSAQEQNSKAARPGDGPLQTAYLTLGESVALFFLPQNRTGEECGAKRD